MYLPYRSVKLKHFHQFKDTKAVSRARFVGVESLFVRIWHCGLIVIPTQALAAATSLVAGDLDSSLKKFLKKKLVKKEFTGKVLDTEISTSTTTRVCAKFAMFGFMQLGISDSKIGGLIKQKLSLNVCVRARHCLA